MRYPVISKIKNNDASSFSLRNIKILTNMQKKNTFEILVLTALTVGLMWTILVSTPKSALLSLTILWLYVSVKVGNHLTFRQIIFEQNRAEYSQGQLQLFSSFCLSHKPLVSSIEIIFLLWIHLPVWKQSNYDYLKS